MCRKLPSYDVAIAGLPSARSSSDASSSAPASSSESTPDLPCASNVGIVSPSGTQSTKFQYGGSRSNPSGSTYPKNHASTSRVPCRFSLTISASGRYQYRSSSMPIQYSEKGGITCSRLLG